MNLAVFLQVVGFHRDMSLHLLLLVDEHIRVWELSSDVIDLPVELICSVRELDIDRESLCAKGVNDDGKFLCQGLEQ